MGLCVFSLSNFLDRENSDDRENVYFILLPSPNRKYVSLTTFQGLFMKQWYPLYVLLFSCKQLCLLKQSYSSNFTLKLLL